MRGLIQCTIDEWESSGGASNPQNHGKYRCLYSHDGEAHRCCYVRGHVGPHKWFHSDKYGDYDLWYVQHQYDYQWEEL